MSITIDVVNTAAVTVARVVVTKSFGTPVIELRLCRGDWARLRRDVAGQLAEALTQACRLCSPQPPPYPGHPGKATVRCVGELVFINGNSEGLTPGEAMDFARAIMDRALDAVHEEVTRNRSQDND